MNSKSDEEKKRKVLLGPQKEWEMILAAISSAEKNMKSDQRKQQFKIAQKAGSPLIKRYFDLT